MQNSYFSKAEFNPLLHLWSLGVEIQFYLILPILVFFFRRHSVFLWLTAITSLAVCFIIVGISPKTSFFMMPLRLWEFLIGYGVATYLTNKGNISEGSNKQILGLLFFLLLLAIPFFKVDGQALSFLTGHPGGYAFIITVSTGFVLAFGLPSQLEKSFIASFLETIGKYSYSIYLVHFPVIVLYLYSPFSGTILHTSNATDLIILIFMIIGLSIALYHLVEIKLRHILILLGMPIAIILMATSGFSAQKYLHSNAELKIFDAFTDRSTYRCGKLFRILNPGELTCEITTNIINPKSRILLVGNSHADSIKTVFANIAASMNVEVYFLVPNNPLMGNDISISRVLEEAIKYDIKHIVMHYSPNAISVGTVSSLASKAYEKGIDVSFIMPVPVWKTHIPKSLYENLEFHKPLPIQTKIDYYRSTDTLRKSLENITLGNFEFYEVYESFCADECALMSKDGKALYFDNGHLTLTGASELSSLFKTVISKTEH